MRTSVFVVVLLISGVCFVAVYSETPPVSPAPASFAADIMPRLVKLGCNSADCHGSSKGKGGLRLALFGGNARQDFETLTRTAPGRWINPVEPKESVLLLKISGGLPHAGGAKAPTGSGDYEALASWVASGAGWGSADLKVASVELSPSAATMKPGEKKPFAVTATFSDGSKRDVTGLALFRVSDATVASCATGGIEAKGPGEAVVVASYMRKSAVARVLVPQALKAPFPDFPANNRVDELVLAKLKELGVPPSGLSSDEEFLRRASLDLLGVLPTADEAKAFLADADAKKRSKLVDRLLDRPEFADFEAMHWSDVLRIKSEYPSNLWPEGAECYYRWVRGAIAANMPCDRFARELLTSTGSNFRDGPANYWRALRKRDAQGYAESTALVFMGARLECARCHVHPTEEWTPRDNMGMSAFFAQVRIKETREWKEEVVYVDPKVALVDPRTREVIAPTPLGSPALKLAEGEDPRAAFAAWLTAPDNPWFARNVVNRVWFWLMGRGIIHEPDDIRPTNPPTNAELLAFLEKELVGHQYDLKHIYRLILNSRTYQLSSTPTPENAKDAGHFARYHARRLGAEQLLDAISRVTESPEEFSSRIPEPFTFLPDGTRASQVPDGSIPDKAGFLELFGKPPRDTAYEEDRANDPTMLQALHLINSTHVAGKISGSPRLARIIKDKLSDSDAVEEIFLSALSRRPTDDEKKRVVAWLSKDPKARKQALEDVMWAVLNTKEFLFNH